MFVRKIADIWYPKVKKITLVMDNYNTHAASAFMKYFNRQKQKGFGIDLNLYMLLNMAVG